jgi:DNA-binding CsgD family transcriptional regulator
MASTELKPLTEKQRRVFELLGQGKTQSEIANDMGIKSLAGVASHIAALTKKGYLDKNGAPTEGATPVEDSAPDISGADKPAEASDNGTHPTFDLDGQVEAVLGEQADSLRRMIEGIDKALAAHGERQAEIEAEAKAHTASVESLREQRDKADKALAAIS